MATYKYDAATGRYIETTDPQALNITTNQLDYASGAIESITASNVDAGGTVEFCVAHVGPGPDGIVGTADDTITYDLAGPTQPSGPAQAACDQRYIAISGI
jgi:hypothetical protein